MRAVLLSTRYTLRFAARLAYWQYQMRGQRPPHLAVFTIAGDTTGLDFKAVPPAAGSTACFRARKAVRLAQHYTLPPLHSAMYHPDADDKKAAHYPHAVTLWSYYWIKRRKYKK